MGRPVTSSEESRRSSRLGIGNNNNNKSGINNRPQTVGHVPVAYDIYGHQVPYGKGSGLKRAGGSIKTLNGTIREPKNWTKMPLHKSRSHLFHDRRRSRLKETEKDLARTEKVLNKVLYDRKWTSTYSKVMAGSAALKVTSPTRSALFSNRDREHLKSLKSKAADYERKQEENPHNKMLQEGMKTYKRRWFQGKADQNDIDGKYAKGVFHPPDLNDPGLKWVDSPKFRTRAKILQNRLKHNKQVGIKRMDESWAISEAKLKKSVEKDKAKRKAMGMHIPKTKNKKELLRRRNEEMINNAKVLSKLKAQMKKEETENVLTKTKQFNGWWESKDGKRTKPGFNNSLLYKMRRKRQENNLVFNDPFKNPQTSLHKLHGERKHGGNTTEKPNNINRFKDGHKMEVRKRVKPPPKAVKRWSDVVIEFKEVEKKRERRELALLNGEILEEDEDPYNPLDYAPMYSSFTHDLTFVEPVYGVIKSAKDEDGWPDIMLKPLHCSASGRKLTMMEKTQRMRRFREHMRAKRLEEESQKMDRIDAIQLQRSSSFHSGLSTPARSVNRVDRPQSALDLTQGNNSGTVSTLQVVSSRGVPDGLGPNDVQSMGTLEKKRRPQSVPAMRMRKSTSALESSTQQLFGISSMGNLGETGGSAGIIRPGTAPLMRSVGDSLKIRTKGFLRR